MKLVEQEPVHWKKAEVWFKVHDRLSANQRSYRFYYYAAAVFFFMFFNISQLQQVSTESVAHGSQLSFMSGVQTLPGGSELVDEVTTAIQTSRIKQESPSTETIFHADEMVMLEPGLLEEVNIQVALEESIISSVNETATQQQVEPIVGIMQLPASNVVSVRPKRKKLFHKLEQDESEFDNSQQNTIVIARIK